MATYIYREAANRSLVKQHAYYSMILVDMQHSSPTGNLLLLVQNSNKEEGQYGFFVIFKLSRLNGNSLFRENTALTLSLFYM